MNKKQSLLFTFFFSLILHTTTNSYNDNILVGYSALKNYIEHCIAQLFYPNHELQDVQNFMHSLTDSIHRQESGWFSLWTNYDRNKVYQLTIGETIEFITQQAHRYGSIQATNIIKEEVTRKIMNHRELPTGILSEYIGASLQYKVSRIETTIQPQANVYQNHLYPSDECCICFSPFDGSIEQIFLTPCGHDLCKDCCKNHFFDFGNKTCPQCRAVINKEILQKIIFTRR